MGTKQAKANRVRSYVPRHKWTDDEKIRLVEFVDSDKGQDLKEKMMASGLGMERFWTLVPQELGVPANGPAASRMYSAVKDSVEYRKKMGLLTAETKIGLRADENAHQQLAELQSINKELQATNKHLANLIASQELMNELLQRLVSGLDEGDGDDKRV